MFVSNSLTKLLSIDNFVGSLVFESHAGSLHAYKCNQFKKNIYIYIQVCGLNSFFVKHSEPGTAMRPCHRLCLLIKSLGNCQWLKIEDNSDTNYKWEYTVHNMAVSTLCTTYVVTVILIASLLSICQVTKINCNVRKIHRCRLTNRLALINFPHKYNQKLP